MRYGYYPGCSLSHSAKPYGDSIQSIRTPLDIELKEVEDWNCCGATEYVALNKTAAFALVGRNLALGSQEGFETLVTPCSACYLNLKKTDHYMGKYKDLDKKTNEALAAGGLSYKPGSLKVRHMLDIVVNDIGFDKIREHVTRPLEGLKVASYYGCLIVRPEFEEFFDDPEFPTHMDTLMETLGADVVDFSMKTHCCGGHMPQISTDTAYSLIYGILNEAQKNGADLLVTICPMCQLNLDAYQAQVNKQYKTKFNLPILYFTQMMGLAFGASEKELGLGKEFVQAAPALKKIGKAVEKAQEKPKRRKRGDKTLPMPQKKVEVKYG
jgi:heterodisulfide reductase subunit B2